MRIIDSTLSLLDDREISKNEAVSFIKLCMKSGISDFMISPKIYQIISEDFPQGNRYYMEIDTTMKRTDYPEIGYFLKRKVAESDTITVVQINDAREILHLRNECNASSIMLIGLDDFLCYDYKKYFGEIKSILSKSNIILCPENSLDLATATATMFIRGGGKEIVTAFAGIGNRAPTEQVMMALRLICKYKVNQDLSVFVDIKKLVEKITGIPIPQKMPVIGERIFLVESGIHVDGIMKNPGNYEIFPPELVGQKRKIVIGKHSGTNSVRIKMQELGMEEATEKRIEELLKIVKKTSVILRRSLTDTEFKKLAGESNE